MAYSRVSAGPWVHVSRLQSPSSPRAEAATLLTFIESLFVQSPLSTCVILTDTPSVGGVINPFFLMGKLRYRMTCLWE